MPRSGKGGVVHLPKLPLTIAEHQGQSRETIQLALRWISRQIRELHPSVPRFVSRRQGLCECLCDPI